MFIQGEAVGDLNLNMQMNYTYCIIKKIASVTLFEKKRAEILNKNRALMSEELNKKEIIEKLYMEELMKRKLQSCRVSKAFLQIGCD